MQLAVRMRRAVPVVSFLCIAACAPRNSTSGIAPPPSAPKLMSPMELQALPAQLPDKRISYGDDSSQYGELRIPRDRAKAPVVVLIHGGCFKAAYATTRDLAPMADALKARGIATWNLEYRRVGQPGGGWPGTYLDVGRGIDYLRTLATEYPLDLDHVVIVGHSAGGHLAMWAAARARVPTSSPVSMPNPLPVRGVINLAGPVDLTANIDGYQGLCRDTVITSLLGGTPSSVAERYAQASPIKLLPFGVPQVIVIGEHEDFVPRPLMEAYVKAATLAGDKVKLMVIPGVGHFEIASPVASPWTQVEAAIRSLLESKVP